jgi:hypothetical protein
MTPRDYGARGMHVFPCNGGRPLTPHGFKDATADLDQIDWLFRGWSDAQIGFWPAPSGVAVLDVDIKHGKDGLANFIRLDGCPILPSVPTVRTPSGGWHFHFKMPDTRISATVNDPDIGLDWRGSGGYVILPSPGSGYHWEHWTYDNSTPKLPEPGLLPKSSEQQQRPVRREAPRVTISSLSGALRCLLGAAEGERNKLLFWTSNRFVDAVESGDIDESSARNLLHQAGNDIGLDDREVTATVASAFKRAG